MHSAENISLFQSRLKTYLYKLLMTFKSIKFVVSLMKCLGHNCISAIEILLLFLLLFYCLSGGNQRELARAKNQKKQQELAKKKGGESGVALKERKERFVIKNK